MVATLFGRPSFDTSTLSADSNRLDPIHKPQATMADAKDSLVNIIDKCIKFMATVAELKYALNIPEEFFVEQRRLDGTFDSWLLRFEDVAKTVPFSNSVNLMVRSSPVLALYFIPSRERHCGSSMNGSFRIAAPIMVAAARSGHFIFEEVALISYPILS
jgi:hypothetical protein